MRKIKYSLVLFSGLLLSGAVFAQVGNPLLPGPGGFAPQMMQPQQAYYQAPPTQVEERPAAPQCGGSGRYDDVRVVTRNGSAEPYAGSH